MRAEDVAPIVRISAGPQAGVRRVTYRDRLTTTLANHQSGLLTLATGAVEIYPAANLGVPIVGSIGLVGSIRQALTGRSQTTDRIAYESRWTAWNAGLRWRGLIGGEERYALTFTRGEDAYALEGPTPRGALLPSGSRSSWRPGLEAWLPIGPTQLVLAGGWSFVTSNTGLEPSFPRVSEAGADGSISLHVPIGAILELRFTAAYTRWFSSLNPEPGDPYVAGGALDQAGLADLSLVVRR